MFCCPAFAAVLNSDTVLAALGRLEFGTRFEYVCPAGFIVTSINGRASDWVEGLGPITCSNGATTSTFPVVASDSSGDAWSHNSQAGYAGIGVVYDWSGLNQITLMPTTGNSVTFGSTDGTSGQLTCPNGTVIAGVFGSADPGSPFIYSIGTVCRKGGLRANVALALSTTAERLQLLVWSAWFSKNTVLSQPSALLFIQRAPSCASVRWQSDSECQPASNVA